MRFGALNITFALLGLCSAVVTAEAGSSATAITTISANIVPAASFTVAGPVTLHRSVGLTEHNAVATSQAGHVTLSSADPTKLQIRSSPSLVYDLSIPASISVPGIAHEVATRFDKTRQRQDRSDTGDQVLMDVVGAVKNTRTQEPGTYQGQIDITVNYN